MAKNRDFSKFPNAITVLDNGNVGIGTTAPIGKFSVKLPTATSVSTIAASGWDSTYAIIGNPDVTTGTSFGVGTNNSLSGINLLACAPASDWVDFNYYSRQHIFFGNGTERMRITSGGEVGIGVTPTSGNRFWVKGSDSTSGNTSLITQNSSGTITMIVRNDGNVGIGTSSPTTILTIRKPIDSSAYGAGTRMIDFKSFFPGFDTETVKASIYAGVSSILESRTDNGFLAFMTADTGTLYERMRIEKNGNVGIGTSSPTFLLSLNKAGNNGLFISNTSGNTAGYLYAGGLNGFEIQSTDSANTTAKKIILQPYGGQILTPNQPAFYAYGVSGGTFATGSYWIFSSTIFNRGNHYNASTGIFTAPVSGIYEFTWSNLGGTGNTVYRYFLYINNSNSQQGVFLQLRIDTTASGSEYGANTSKTALVNLAANDTVRIYYYSDSGDSSYPNENSPSNEYPTFMGKLIG